MHLLSLTHKPLSSLHLKAWDPLLLISCFLFLDPMAAAGGSSLPALAWLGIEMTLCSCHDRGLLWPLAAILLNGWATMEQYPLAIISYSDIVLLVVSVITISRLAPKRLLSIQLMLLLVLPVGAWIVWIHPVPPENMRGFLAGMLASLSLAHAAGSCSARKKILLILIAIGGIWMGLGYDSVAAIIFPIVAIVLAGLVTSISKHRIRVAMASMGIACLGALVSVSYSSLDAGWVNSQYVSNLGRLQVWACYLHATVGSLRQFLFGVGFDKTSSVCLQPVASGILPHSHNFFLQILTGSGALGLAGVILFLLAFLAAPLINWELMDNRLKIIWTTGLFYFLLQSFTDISAYVNPVTIIMTGFLLAAPSVFNPQRDSCQSQR